MDGGNTENAGGIFGDGQPHSVIPAEAGIQWVNAKYYSEPLSANHRRSPGRLRFTPNFGYGWIPAFAGMTGG